MGCLAAGVREIVVADKSEGLGNVRGVFPSASSALAPFGCLVNLSDMALSAVILLRVVLMSCHARH